MAYIITEPESQASPGEYCIAQANELNSHSRNSIIVYFDGVEHKSNSEDGETNISVTFTAPKYACTIKIVAKEGVKIAATKYIDVVSSSSSGGSSGSGSGGSSSGGGSTVVYNPTIGSFTLTPLKNDGSTSSIAVQGKTRIQASVSGCTAGSGYISSYTFTSPSTSYNTSSTYNIFSSPSGSGWQTYGVYVYNSAGGSTYTSSQIYVYPYSAPYFTKFNAYRSNSSGSADVNGEYITCEYQVNYSTVNDTNGITVKIYCNGSEITQMSTTSGKYTTTGTYSIDLQHNLYAIVTDTYGSSIKSATESIYPSGKILNIAADGQSIGIGGLAPSTSNTLSCYWDMIVASLNGRRLPEIEFGKISVAGNGSNTTTSVTYEKAFSNSPCVYFISPLPHWTIQAILNSFSSTGFTATITPGWSGGSWDVYWVAIYIP